MHIPEQITKFLIENEQQIIETWLMGVENDFPNQYNSDDLRKNGAVYITLLRDVHIPVDEHPSFEIIPRTCEYHAGRNTPIEHILHSSHIWRKCLIKSVHMHLIKERMPIEEATDFFECLHERIDYLQRAICQHYWKYAKQLVKERDEIINQLHEDRLNLLGKMAASMAHEIKNPLFAIEGFLKLLRSELPLESLHKVREYLSIIDREFKGLYQQITNLLSFSKDNGLEEPVIAIDSGEIIKSVLDLISPQLADESIELNLQLEKHANILVQRQAIQQVIMNLVSNSIDALREVNHPKKITIRTYEEQNYYYISVEDNGEGIPKDLEPNLFTPFVTGKKNGTGLGLSICKQIMEKNFGDITFTSTHGKTEFVLSLVKERRINFT